MRAFCTQQMWKEVYGLPKLEKHLHPEEEEKRSDLSSSDEPSIELSDSEEDFVQWLSRLLLENQRHVRNEPIKNFSIK